MGTSLSRAWHISTGAESVLGTPSNLADAGWIAHTGTSRTVRIASRQAMCCVGVFDIPGTLVDRAIKTRYGLRAFFQRAACSTATMH